MPVQPANAVCSGHRHAITGLRWSLPACLSLPRARGERRRLSNGYRAFQPFRLADDFRRGVRRGKDGWTMLRRYRSSKQKTHCHRADTCASCLAPSIGTLPPHRWPDSSICIRSIRCRTPLHRLRGMRSLIPTAADCRDRHRQRCAQRNQRPRCSAYRPRHQQ